MSKLKQTMVKIFDGNHLLSKPQVHNLSGIPLDHDTERLLSLGSNFILKPKPLTSDEIHDSLKELTRKIALRKYFGSKKVLAPFYAEGNKSWIPIDGNYLILRGIINTEVLSSQLESNQVMLNLSRPLFRSLINLSKLMSDHKLMLLEADKNMGLCIIRQDDYMERMEREIHRLSSSFSVQNMINQNLICQSCRDQADALILLIKTRMRPHRFKDDLMKYLEGNHVDQFAEMKGFPKLHKTGERMRLILPFHDSIWTGIHKFLAKVLQPLAMRVETAIISTTELVEDLSSFGNSLRASDLLVTGDLESMYNNINMSLAISFVLELIDRYHPEYLMFGSSEADNRTAWKELLTGAFSHMYFRFGELLVHQRRGVPMGSPAGPVLAIIYMGMIFEKTRHRVPHMLYGKMYIDDGFFIFRGSNPVHVMTYLNELISFGGNTVEWDPTSVHVFSVEDLLVQKLPFLDINIYSEETPTGFRFITGCYFKEMGTYQYLHYRSAHPRDLKMAIMIGEGHRRLRNCLTQHEYETANQDLRMKLLNRDYPYDIITEQMRKVPFEKRDEILHKTLGRLHRMRSSCRNPWYTNKVTISRMVPLVIRYDPRVHRSLRLLRRKIQKDLDENFFDQHHDPCRVVIAYKKSVAFANRFRSLT